MRVALIGYGEVGRILAEDLHASAHDLTAFDLKFGSRAGEPLQAHALANGVRLADSHAGAVEAAQLVVCAVTASQTVAAAAACAAALPEGCFFLDFNSASPGAKKAAADQVQSGRGRYVEGAVMTSVPPHRIRVPLLLGGPHAAMLEPVLKALGFAALRASDQLGVASATKMCRSVIVKGLEAMVIESFTAARRYGVEDGLLASLHETFPGIDWEKHAAYFFRRVIAHGRRRAEEMSEAAATVREAGLEPWSAAGTAKRQAWMADLADADAFTQERAAPPLPPDWREEADRILRYVDTAKEH